MSNRLERMKKQMVRWMCGVSLRDRVPSEKLRVGRGLKWCLICDKEKQAKFTIRNSKTILHK